jgi:5'-3' exonuclease
MGIKQYVRDAMEADDLIYAFCHFYNGDEITIFSSDKDLYQIPYYFDSVSLYDTGDKKIIDRPKINPVRIKCLQGDSSDNIDGYHGVGKIKSPKLAGDNKLIAEFLESKGDEQFSRNLRLIDLALCPYILDNIRYIIAHSNKPPIFDREALKDILYSKHNIRGIDSVYRRMLLQFSKLDRS